MQINRKSTSRRGFLVMLARLAAALGLTGLALSLCQSTDKQPLSFNKCQGCRFGRSTCVPATPTCRKDTNRNDKAKR
jgi:hypothetical protein